MMLRETALLALLLLTGVEGDWYTRVKEQGLPAACAEEVSLHEKGVLRDSLHVGECYYRLSRWAEGTEVFSNLLNEPDRNYVAMARARLGEGYWHQGKVAKARAAFTLCLEEHPEAWLDGSVADLCRSWLKKIDGKLESGAGDGAEATPSIDAVKEEIRALEKRIDELKKLIRKVGEDK